MREIERTGICAGAGFLETGGAVCVDLRAIWILSVAVGDYQRLGLKDTDKSRTLMVGDRKFDVIGAREFGIDCVGVDFFGYAAPGELVDAGAVAVVQTVEALEAFILSH